MARRVPPFPRPAIGKARFRATALVACSAASVLLGLSVPQANAGCPFKPQPQAYKQTYDQIQAVDPAARTVTIATMSREVTDRPNNSSANHRGSDQSSSKERNHVAYREASVTLQVNAFTDIEVKGKKTNFQALHPGMQVDVTRGMDQSEAERLVVKN